MITNVRYGLSANFYIQNPSFFVDKKSNLQFYTP